MSAPSRPRSRESGLTMVELMIAMLILGLVVATAFQIAFSIMNGYRDHRRAMAVERAARGAVSVLSDAIRNASPGVRDAMNFDVVGCSALRGVEVINASDAPDELEIIYASSGGIITSLREAFDQTQDSVIVEDASLLKDGDHVLVTDFTHGRVVRIEGDPVESGGGWTLALADAPEDACTFPDTYPTVDENAFTYAVRATVIKVQVARFFLGGDIDTPVLMMDPDGEGALEAEAIAEGIEDLQIAVGIDDDGDGTVEELGVAGDDDEWYYNHPDDNAPTTAITTRPYRALRITVVSRSMGETTTTVQATSLRPAAEDRPISTTADIYKRRALSTTVEIRNFAGSPL